MSYDAAHGAPLDSTDTGRLSTGPTVVDGRPVRGLAVITSGANETGTPAVAVWQLDLTGNPSGAWVTAEDDLLGAERTRQVLTLCERRALVAYNDEGVADALAVLRRVAEIAEAGDVVEDAWARHVCRIDTAITETARARVASAAAVAAEKERTRRSLGPLKWRIPIPDAAPDTLEKLLDAAQVPLAQREASDAATAALALSRAVRWSLSAWADSEAARYRRVYLRQTFGPQQPLPPTWRTAATGAYEQVHVFPASRSSLASGPHLARRPVVPVPRCGGGQ
jgi:hypothetical protein